MAEGAGTCVRRKRLRLRLELRLRIAIRVSNKRNPMYSRAPHKCPESDYAIRAARSDTRVAKRAARERATSDTRFEWLYSVPVPPVAPAPAPSPNNMRSGQVQTFVLGEPIIR